jgi:hypothetical protein
MPWRSNGHASPPHGPAGTDGRGHFNRTARRGGRLEYQRSAPLRYVNAALTVFQAKQALSQGCRIEPQSVACILERESMAIGAATPDPVAGVAPQPAFGPAFEKNVDRVGQHRQHQQPFTATGVQRVDSRPNLGRQQRSFEVKTVGLELCFWAFQHRLASVFHRASAYSLTQGSREDFGRKVTVALIGSRYPMQKPSEFWLTSRAGKGPLPTPGASERLQIGQRPSWMDRNFSAVATLADRPSPQAEAAATELFQIALRLRL